MWFYVVKRWISKRSAYTSIYHCEKLSSRSHFPIWDLLSFFLTLVLSFSITFFHSFFVQFLSFFLSHSRLFFLSFCLFFQNTSYYFIPALLQGTQKLKHPNTTLSVVLQKGPSSRNKIKTVRGVLRIWVTTASVMTYARVTMHT